MMTEGEQEKKKEKKNHHHHLAPPTYTHALFCRVVLLENSTGNKKKKKKIANYKFEQKNKNSIFLDIPDGFLFISFPCVIDMSPIS